jgi:microcystin-dependent protein
MISRREAFAASLLGLFPEGQLLAFESDDGKSETLEKLNQLIKTLADALQRLRLTSPPIGSVQAFAGEWPPRNADSTAWTELDIGWLLCDGRGIADTEASLHGELQRRGKQAPAGGLLKELRAVLRTNQLPDLRGHTLVTAGTGVDLSPRKLGEIGGKETHTLIIGEMPTHYHKVTDPGHEHFIHWGAQVGAGASSHERSGQDSWNPKPVMPHTYPAKTGITETDNIGNNRPHNNMQPFAVVNSIIKFA